MLADPSRVARRLCPLALGLGLAVAPTAAEAAPTFTGKTNKRFRFHIDTALAGFAHFDSDEDSDFDVNSGGFGFGRPTLVDRGYALTLPMLGLGFGFVFLDSRAIVGARFSFTVDGSNETSRFFGSEDVRVTVVTGQFVPYFRWVFLPGRRVRPYVEGHVGLGGSAVYTDIQDQDDTTDRAIYPVVGPAGGVHIFVIDAFSFDAGIGLDYIAPHVKVDGEDDDFDKIGDVVNLYLLAGISVWFG